MAMLALLAVIASDRLTITSSASIANFNPSGKKAGLRSVWVNEYWVLYN
jgi:hypothetical protein